MGLPQIQWEGGLSSIQHRPPTGNSFTQSLGEPVERFVASLRDEQRGKLEQLGIEIGSTDCRSANCSRPQCLVTAINNQKWVQVPEKGKSYTRYWYEVPAKQSNGSSHSIIRSGGTVRRYGDYISPDTD